MYTFTQNYSSNKKRTIQAIKDEGMKAGVALNPHTPVNLLANLLNELDLVCIMGKNLSKTLLIK